MEGILDYRDLTRVLSPNEKYAVDISSYNEILRHKKIIDAKVREMDELFSKSVRKVESYVYGNGFVADDKTYIKLIEGKRILDRETRELERLFFKSVKQVIFVDK